VDTTTVLERMLLDIKHTQDINVCVCSFSEDGDSLSQWRAYSGDSSGFSIGFKPNALDVAIKDENFSLFRCIYNEKVQQNIAIEIVEKSLSEELNKEKVEKQNGVILLNTTNIHDYVYRYAPILKDASFSDENEWRLISKPLSCGFDRFHYREGKSMIIPYYSVPLTKNDSQIEIAEVFIGPNPHRHLSKLAVTGFFVKHNFYDFEGDGINSIKIMKSTVPYRSW